MAFDSHYYSPENETVQVLTSKSPNWRKYILIGVVVALLVIVLVVSLSVVLAKSKSGKQTSERNLLLLVSLDGFRYDYLGFGLTPNLNRIASSGVQAEYLRPVFPTNTFPNHYSIATGLYPESHGIVTNNFYDADLNDTFRLGSEVSLQEKWWGGEPIWVTAIKQGLKSASFFWVGSEAPVQGIRPNYWKKFNKTIPFSTRVEQVIRWMLLEPDKRPNVITLYFEQPDKKGHSTGPISAEVKDTIKLVDSVIGELLKKLEDNDLVEKVNMIIVSDHGMAKVDCNHTVNVDLLTDLSNVTVMGLGSSSMLYPKTKEDGEKVNNDVKVCLKLKPPDRKTKSFFTQPPSLCADKMLRALHKDKHTPRRMHYCNNKRIGDIFLTPKKGWQVLRNNTCQAWRKGYHGVDNIEMDMQAIFVAAGPDFKSNYSFENFQNVEIYNLMTDLLRLKPAPNNGTAGSLRHLLKPDFLNTLEPLESKSKQQTQCGFPDNLVEALNSCRSCQCPYCDRNVSINMTSFREHLNLNREEVLQSQEKHLPWSMPHGDHVQCILTQKNYVTGYNTRLHIPIWVGYKLTKKQLLVNVPRENCFRRDIRLNSSQSAYCSSYYRSGYDRGHLAPAGDFNFDRYAAQDTFVLSNIVPQHKYLNRYGSWRYLESLTRDLTLKYENVYVLSGSIFDMNNDGIYDAELDKKRWLHNTTGGIPIPTHYFKILSKCKDSSISVLECANELDTLAFIVPHNEEKLCSLHTVTEYTKQHVATITDIELITGLTFFSNLNSLDQARLKVKLNTEIWPH